MADAHVAQAARECASQEEQQGFLIYVAAKGEVVTSDKLTEKKKRLGAEIFTDEKEMKRATAIAVRDLIDYQRAYTSKRLGEFKAETVILTKWAEDILDSELEAVLKREARKNRMITGGFMRIPGLSFYDYIQLNMLKQTYENVVLLKGRKTIQNSDSADIFAFEQPFEPVRSLERLCALGFIQNDIMHSINPELAEAGLAYKKERGQYDFGRRELVFDRDVARSLAPLPEHSNN